MRIESITLAGEVYEVAELPMRANAEWRRELQQTLEPVGDLYAESRTIEFTQQNAGSILDIVRKAGDLLISSPETITDLVFSYSPALAADRERIGAEAYDSEVMDALTAILRLAFPFGRLLRTVQRMAVNGAAAADKETT